MLLNLTASDWKLKAREEIGDVAKNHIFEARLPLSSSGGAWKAIFNGSPSDAISYVSSAGAVKVVLEGIDTIGQNNVSVRGIPKGPYQIEFIGDLGGIDLNGVLTTDGTSLIPQSSVTLSTIQIGQSTSFQAEAEKMWQSMEEASINFHIRYLVIKKELGKKKLGSMQGQVDTKDRDYEEKRSQAVSELRRIIFDTETELRNSQMQSDVSGSNASGSVKINRREYGLLELDNGLVYKRGGFR